MPKRIEQILTESARPVADRMAKRASLKLVLSAGIFAFESSTPEKREFYIDLANGLKANELLAKQRQKQLNVIFEPALNNPRLSTSQKKRLTQAFELLQSLLVDRLAPPKKKSSATA